MKDGLDNLLRRIDVPGLDVNGRSRLAPTNDSGMTSNVVIVQPRSTYDPFQINFASISIAEQLQSKHVTRRQRMWAWWLLVFPSVLGALYATVDTWKHPPIYYPGNYGFSLGDYLVLFLFMGIPWLPVIFWIIVMYRKRPTAIGGVGIKTRKLEKAWGGD